MEKKINLIYALLSVLVVIVLAQSYLIYDFKKNVNKQDVVVNTHTTNYPASSQFFNNFNAKNTDPFEQMKKMQEEMQKSFGHFNSVFADDPFFQSAFKDMSISPLSDFKATDKEYILELNIPGSSEQKIDIKTQNNILKISAVTEVIKDENNTKYMHKERFTQRFERSFTLPLDADVDKLKSNYESGVLKITIPKKG